MNINKNILITGSNRSGSTWVGNVISSNTKVDNIIEPLNLNRIRRYNRIELDFWYPKIEDSSPEKLQRDVLKLMEYYLKTSYKTVFSDVFEHYEGHDLFRSTKKRWRRAGKPIKMLKDPTAIFSVPWLVNKFDLKPIILIRHPAAYVLSIKEKNWWFDFDNFLKQPNFFSRDLQHLEEEVTNFKEQETKRDIVENASLLWKVFYSQVAGYKKNHPEWFYITHEELSLNPTQEFKNIFTYLGLDFTDSVQNYIDESTQSKEKDVGKHKRNSVKNSKKWRDKLSPMELDKIHEITSPIAELFYDKFVIT
jgi:Sulfotransferase domain